jgi:A/G-specific adenine glycosylase
MWYDANKRDLPWRATKDPYAVWVSETMLQQTTVAAVVPFYERWMERFPTVESLAKAKIDTVLRHWQGLGYYRRARNLHAAARIVANAGMPRTYEAWRALPGVGDYTAGAVCSIAFGLPVPAVDANVQRVYARFARDASVVGARSWAGRLVASGRSGDVNQALMDLGATVCRPRDPDCSQCPVRKFCACAVYGDPHAFPAAKPRKEVVAVRQHAIVAFDGKRLGVVRFAKGEWWEGMHGFPRRQAAPRKSRPLGTVRHTVTRHKIELEAHVVRSCAGVVWMSPEQLEKVAMPSPDRKVLRLFLQSMGSKPTGNARRPSSAKK